MLRLLRRVVELLLAASRLYRPARTAPLQRAAGTIFKCFLVAHLNACVLGGSSPSLRVLESDATSPLCSTVMYVDTRRARGCPARASLAPVISPLECEAVACGCAAHLGV
jgi:hypothetical protein